MRRSMSQTALGQQEPTEEAKGQREPTAETRLIVAPSCLASASTPVCSFTPTCCSCEPRNGPGRKHAAIFAFWVVEIGVLVWALNRYLSDAYKPARDAIGMGLVVSRVSAALMGLPILLLLVSVARWPLAACVLRGAMDPASSWWSVCAWPMWRLSSAFPVEQYRKYHRHLAWTTVFLVALHVLAHYANFASVWHAGASAAAPLLSGQGVQAVCWGENLGVEPLNATRAEKNSINAPWSMAALLLRTVPGLTGHVATAALAMLVLPALQPCRKHCHGLFAATHQTFFLVFVVALAAHGSAAWLDAWRAPMWLLPGAVLAAIPLARRWMWRGTVTFKLQTCVVDESRVCRLEVEVPYWFRARAGDWVNLRISALNQEWHAFSIASLTSPDGLQGDRVDACSFVGQEVAAWACCWCVHEAMKGDDERRKDGVRTMVLYARPLGDWTKRLYTEVADSRWADDGDEGNSPLAAGIGKGDKAPVSTAVEISKLGSDESKSLGGGCTSWLGGCAACACCEPLDGNTRDDSPIVQDEMVAMQSKAGRGRGPGTGRGGSRLDGSGETTRNPLRTAALLSQNSKCSGTSGSTSTQRQVGDRAESPAVAIAPPREPIASAASSIGGGSIGEATTNPLQAFELPPATLGSNSSAHQPREPRPPAGPSLCPLEAGARQGAANPLAGRRALKRPPGKGRSAGARVGFGAALRQQGRPTQAPASGACSGKDEWSSDDSDAKEAHSVRGFNSDEILGNAPGVFGVAPVPAARVQVDSKELVDIDLSGADLDCASGGVVVAQGPQSPELSGVERRKLFTLRSKSMRSIRRIVTADDLAAVARDEGKSGVHGSPSRRGLVGRADSHSAEAADEAGSAEFEVAPLPRVNIDGPFPTATGLAAAPRYFNGGVLLMAAGVGATPLMALLRQWAALSAVLRKERPQLALDPFSADLPFPNAVLLVWTVPTVAACSWGLGAIRSVVLDPILQHRVRVLVHVTREKDTPASITFHRGLDADQEAVTPGQLQVGDEGTVSSSPRARSRRSQKAPSDGDSREARLHRASVMLLAAHGATTTDTPKTGNSASPFGAAAGQSSDSSRRERLSEVGAALRRNKSMRDIGRSRPGGLLGSHQVDDAALAGSYSSRMDDEMAEMLRGIEAGIAPARARVSSVVEFGRRGIVELHPGRPEVPKTFEMLEAQLRHAQLMQEAQHRRVVGFRAMDNAVRCGVFVCGPQQLAMAASRACDRANALGRIHEGLMPDVCGGGTIATWLDAMGCIDLCCGRMVLAQATARSTSGPAAASMQRARLVWDMMKESFWQFGQAAIWF